MKSTALRLLTLVIVIGFALALVAQSGSGRAVIYVMPDAQSGPETASSSPVVDASHNGKEPQVAKTYQELQHRKECQSFAENMNRDKADYFLLLQHGGGLGNRWAVSNKNGDVLASGETMTIGGSVKDACLAMARDWQGKQVTAAK